MGRDIAPVRVRDTMRAHTGTVARVYAAIVCSPLRYLIILGWISLAVLSILHPVHGEEPSDAAGSLPVPSDAPAIQVEKRSLDLFHVPVLSRALIVQRDARGLPVDAQKRVVVRAIDITEGRFHDLPGMVAALPLINSRRLVPGSREDGTTALTYLYFKPGFTARDYDRLAETLEQNHIRRPGDHLIGATGFAPAWARQGDIVGDSLRPIELATVILIFIIVGLTFRSFVAPVLTLLAAGIAYILGERSVAVLAQHQHAAIPVELRPLLVVLVLAVCTDYAIFYMAGFRHRLPAHRSAVSAARSATAETSPIIAVAGLTIASCTGCLLLGKLEFLRILGPALSVAVLTALVVSITLVPACMAAFGRATFWPRAYLRHADEEVKRPGRLRRWATWWPVALLTSALCVAGLLYLAGSISRISVGLGLLDGLPLSLPEARAYVEEQKGFAPGYLSPTLILFRGTHVQEHRAALRRLEGLIAGEPGVSGTIGPNEQPLNRNLGIVFATSGHAARMIVIFEHDPFSGSAVADLSALERDMPALMQKAGIDGLQVGFAGDTALVKYIVDAIHDSVLPIGIAIGLIVFLLLAFLLRSLVAPVYLLGASALAVIAPLGLTVLLFQEWFHHESLAYYVPIGAGVLLFALGSDYNLFLVGRIWDEAEDLPLREAVASAGMQATHTIGAAAVTLAASFALLLIIPLTGFREFAFAMAVGVMIDAFVVRSYLVPALIALVGQLGLHPRGARQSAAQAPVESGR